MANATDAASRREIAVRIISPDLSSTEAAVVNDAMKHLGFGSFNFQKTIPSETLPMVHGEYITSTTYLRFYFDPTFIDRPYFLYLDADTLVLGDLSDAFNYVAPDTLGAVRDELNHTVGQGQPLPGLTKKFPQFAGLPYCNAGALWMQTETIAKVAKGVLYALRIGREFIYLNDQDALNLWLLISRVAVQVPAPYNRFELGRFREESDWITTVTGTCRSIADARLLHFVGPNKPCQPACPGVEGVSAYRSFHRQTAAMVRRLKYCSLH